MYNAFFGFEDAPFRVNPDPRFLYLSDSHREALATLVYAVQERKGFIVLTGEVGTGKTTLLNALLGRLGPDVQSAFVFNPALGLEDFLSYVFDELGLEPVEPFRKAVALRRLNAFLIDRLRKDKQTLLIIDEAQNLSEELLEEIRMLSNLETPRSKLLQIVLVGQPELASKLAQPELRQLRQRVELRHEIRPLDADEVAAYVAERLRVAGYQGPELFGPQATRALHHFSAGIPRVINVLCDNALLTAFAEQSPHVSARMVQAAAGDAGLLRAPTPERRIAGQRSAGSRRWWARLGRRRGARV